MFTIEMLAAGNGDCLWVEFGDPASPKVMLIDGGIEDTEAALRAKIATRTAGGKSLHIELVVCTHIDNDHIEGLLGLLKDLPPRVSIGDIWFNGRKQLKDNPAVLGVPEGEALSDLLGKGPLPWNLAVKGKALVIPDDGPLPVYLVGGMTLTLLSPTSTALAELRRKWASIAPWHDAGSDTVPAGGAVLGGPTIPQDMDSLKALADIGASGHKDNSVTNGSSIAFLAEYDGHSCLFAADAHANILLSSIRRLCESRNISRLKVGALKLSHHGSKHNTSKALVELLDCGKYLISTSGKQPKHPDVQTIARILCYSRQPVTLYFNYASEQTSPWNGWTITDGPSFKTVYGTLPVSL
jgi:hypothetical protein